MNMVLRWAILVDEVYVELEALLLAKSGGVPFGTSSIFVSSRDREPRADRRQESLISESGKGEL